ncbi:MAG: SGNH/GDSL hydrolase family protein [Cyclobacteriaceae bacterium]
MNKLIFALAYFMCTMTIGCSDEPSGIKDGTSASADSLSGSNADFNILFIGNSLTYTNNLPRLVQKKAEQKGIIVGTKMIAFGNYAIIDHWNDGTVQVEIASKKYDFVVIQQGPSSQSFGREILIEYGKKFSEICKENNAKLSYYMVWPSRKYYHTFDGVIKNHEEAASINDAVLCPVGRVWKEHFDSTNNFDYYGADGFHPSLKGSEVAADVIIDSLFP